MIKLFIIVFFVLGAGYVIAYDPSKEYWEAVGPKWDRMLNPCKYNECTQGEGNE
jgi:hypothetical protein